MAAAEMGQWPLPGAAAAAAVPPAAAVQAAPPAAAAVAAVAPAAGVAVAIAAAQQQQDVEADGEGLEVEIEAADAGAEEEEEGGGPQQQQQPAELPAWALPPPPPPPPAVGAGHGGGGGEVMLEDVGLIVDGLVGNLQEGAIPLHLQRIIERFESIIQLDLTRRASSSPWTWPTGGLGLVREAVGPGGFVGVGQDGSGRGCWQQEQREEEWEEEWQWDEQKRGGCDNNSSSRGSGDGSSNGGAGSSSSSALRSFELALLKPSDVARLSELPAEVREKGGTCGCVVACLCVRLSVVVGEETDCAAAQPCVTLLSESPAHTHQHTSLYTPKLAHLITLPALCTHSHPSCTQMKTHNHPPNRCEAPST